MKFIKTDKKQFSMEKKIKNIYVAAQLLTLYFENL